MYDVCVAEIILYTHISVYALQQCGWDRMERSMDRLQTSFEERKKQTNNKKRNYSPFQIKLHSCHGLQIGTTKYPSASN